MGTMNTSLFIILSLLFLGIYAQDKPFITLTEETTNDIDPNGIFSTSFQLDNTYTDEEIIVYIPLFSMVITFFLGVICTLGCMMCIKKSKKKKSKKSQLSYEEVYPVEQFANYV